jgi:hypothetical protein
MELREMVKADFRKVQKSGISNKPVRANFRKPEKANSKVKVNFSRLQGISNKKFKVNFTKPDIDNSTSSKGSESPVLKVDFTKRPKVNQGNYRQPDSQSRDMFNGLLSIKGMDASTQEELLKWVTQNNVKVLYQIDRPTFEELEKAENISSKEVNKWVYSQRYKQIVYWGNLTEKLKKNLSGINTVIHIDANYTSETHFDEIITLPKSDLDKMPTSISTVAYNASKEIRQELANSGIYNARHFQEITTITISTTVDEIELLWNVGGKYRTGFQSDNDRMLLPVIFTVVKGAENAKEYQRLVKKLGTVIKNFNVKIEEQVGTNNREQQLKQSQFNKLLSTLNTKDNKIKIDKEKCLSVWQYSYLDKRTQLIMINALEKVIDSGFDAHKVLKVVCYLADDLIDIINGFEPLEHIPKLVIEHTKKRAFTEYECIVLYYLNKIGFDIVILSPMGYISIENQLSGKFTECNNGNYLPSTETGIQKMFNSFKDFW